MILDTYEYVLYQLLNTPIRNYPFEHIYVQDVFPSEFYHSLLSNLPEKEHYSSIEKLGRVSKGHYLERSLFPLVEESIHLLPIEKKTFWLNFLNMFASKEFEQAALFVFADLIEEKFGSLATQPKLKWVVELVKDTANYSIGPHTDIPEKIITLIFYLPENSQHPHIGTSLFAPKNVDYSDPHGHHHHFEGFKLITTMPYTPNTMFGFIRQDTSWHGVVPIKEPIERNSLTFQLILDNP